MIFHPSISDPDTLSLDVTGLVQGLAKRDQSRLRFHGGSAEKPDCWHCALLCACRSRPSHRPRAPEERDEFSAVHSITSSARASSVGGTVSPSALAILKFKTSSNLV